MIGASQQKLKNTTKHKCISHSRHWYVHEVTPAMIYKVSACNRWYGSPTSLYTLSKYAYAMFKK